MYIQVYEERGAENEIVRGFPNLVLVGTLVMGSFGPWICRFGPRDDPEDR